MPEVRLVVLGWRWPGKSLTGNTIMGREEFHLERAAEFCVKRETEVEGRQVVVVDTPGWFSAQDTPPSYKKELVRGASLCPPGPHAFLLVIPVGMFTEVDRARIEEHVSLFGEAVWRHTMVVFTWAEVLRTISIERYIRREGKDLKWVLEKCKRRYFVINNSVFGEDPQVGRLMERVDKMVAEEGHYDPEEAAVAAAIVRLPEVRLVVLGWRWPGKSLTGNTIMGREEFHLERAAEFCVKRETEVEGRQVVVELVRGASLCPPGPHAFLLVIPVGMFTEVDRARIEEHVSLFGEAVWRHTMVVFTWAEVLRTISIERYIRREGKDLKWVLEKCKRRYFVINNSVFGEDPQVGRLMERVDKMVAEEGHYDPEIEEPLTD
ncbi:unnamed protein product [Menidia menidia]|uniref:(Atlantic silverside) hypothetical protein n=1 Tax=Menidia menidia TaxID=238744 RepID=A0A8S4AX23_9TELE|nr:unnamed protein product [Menidia menidia]